MALKRPGGRAYDALRTVAITPNFTKYAEGSVLIEMGDTRVICTASVEDRVPPFLRNSGKGWVTAEYGMLPRATDTRTQRDGARASGPSGRTQEIQRLIGRSLRAVAATNRLGERTITVDCDVIQADGGTRTASVTGGFVALALALKRLRSDGKIDSMPLSDYVAAVSAGVVSGQAILDLEYSEDSRADVDMNVVRTGAGAYIEVQGTAESGPFSEEQMRQMLDLAGAGIKQLVAKQREVLDAAGVKIGLSGLFGRG
jgi:ribonuclease PH